MIKTLQHKAISTIGSAILHFLPVQIDLEGVKRHIVSQALDQRVVPCEREPNVHRQAHRGSEHHRAIHVYENLVVRGARL